MRNLFDPKHGLEFKYSSFDHCFIALGQTSQSAKRYENR